MKDRCSNANRVDYKYYGGRGITVCKRWLGSFEKFYADMGEPPVGLTLDRIDNNEGYSKKNCRWATRKEQTYNSRNVRYVTHRGETKAVQEWCQLFGISRSCFYLRIKRGLTVEEALTTKVRGRHGRSQGMAERVQRGPA